MPKLAVLGQPVAHSRSPAMHKAALREMGLAGVWSYEAIEVSPQRFEGRVRTMPGEGFAGANVTVPHKLAALALADYSSQAAREIGAANTLSFTESGTWAENTDAEGIIDALPEPPEGQRALVLGAGGSARAAVWALKRAGADVAIWNRTTERAVRLASDLGVRAIVLTDPSAVLDMAGFDLILNATIVGLEAANSGLGASPDRGPADLKRLHLDADAFKAEHVVVDLAYGTAETPLTAAARAAGTSVVDGLDVLAHQGAASLRHWTGVEPPLEVMRDAARRDR